MVARVSVGLVVLGLMVGVSNVVESKLVTRYTSRKSRHLLD